MFCGHLASFLIPEANYSLLLKQNKKQFSSDFKNQKNKKNLRYYLFFFDFLKV
nr:MAG TPA: hypothetical protein [Bacteriophage sp.]